jgi:hypothetical protein
MPGFSGGLVVTTLVCFVFISHARLRVHRAPGIPHALCSEGGNKWIPRAKKSCGENAVVCPVVIARSTCDEAIHLSACRAMDCFAALAMTNQPQVRATHSTSSLRSQGRQLLRIGDGAPRGRHPSCKLNAASPAISASSGCNPPKRRSRPWKEVSAWRRSSSPKSGHMVFVKCSSA